MSAFLYALVMTFLIFIGVISIIGIMIHFFNNPDDKNFSDNIHEYYVDEITLSNGIKIYEAYGKCIKDNNYYLLIDDNENEYFNSFEDAKQLCIYCCNTNSKELNRNSIYL